MPWDRRRQVIVLGAALAVWAGAAYWRPGQSSPTGLTQSRAQAGRGAEAKAMGGRKATTKAAGPPTLRLDLVDRPVPALRGDPPNLFVSLLSPPPPASAPPALPGSPAALAAPVQPPTAPPGPPPPDPFLEEAKRLRVVAVVLDRGEETAFIADGTEIHGVKKNEVLLSRFLIKDLTEDTVVVSAPSGEKEVRLLLVPPAAAGTPGRQP